MRVLDDRKRRSAGAVRLAVLTLGVSLLGLFCLAKAGGQGTTTQSHAVAVKSNPPGATIWKKDGRDFTCMNTVAPGTVDLTFHGDMDVQRLKLRRFGYAPKVLDVKSSDKELEATLDPKNYETSFLLASDAPPELIKLNDALRTEFGKTLLFEQEAFRCAPFDLYFIHLTKDEETGAPNLNVALRLDRSFGGPAFRLAGHTSNSQERHQKMGQAALDSGMAEVVARFHRVAAKFPDLKVITVSGFYSTTEAVLETERVSSLVNQQYVDSGARLGIDGNMHYNTLQMHTVQVWNENTVVKDQTVEKAITFIVPAAKIPDSLDKKTISDAVLTEGQVILAGNIDVNSDPSHAIVKSAGGGSGGSIFEAANAGDLNRVQTLLKAHPELISSKDAGGDTALHTAVAAKAGKPLVEFLLASNADVNARDNNGCTPLCFAASVGAESMVQLLLDHKADINAKANSGDTVLLSMALIGTPTMVELLLTHGADVNVRDAAGRTPLHYAAIGGRPQVVQLFLAHGADANAKDLKGVTPLAFMTNLKVKIKTPQQKEIVALLRQAESSQPHITAQAEVQEAAALPPQPAVAPSPSRGHMDIFQAFEAGELQEVQALLKENPSLVGSKGSKDDCTPLHLAVMAGASKELVEFILANHADVNAKENNGWTPLHYAASTSNQLAAELLLAHHADMEARGNLGETPLFVAAGLGTPKIAEFLLANRADVNAKDNSIRTPLHFAAAQGNLEISQVLLAHKAEIEARDKNGQTAFVIAVLQAHNDVAELLLAHGADVNTKDKDGGTPLHEVASFGQKDAVVFLLAHKADVNAKDDKGRTPLDFAKATGHSNDVVRLLRQHGAH
jgi:ankyrin repeat protein